MDIITFFRSRPLLATCIAASLGSILLSFWAIYLDPALNNDAIIYIRLADQIKESGIKSALQPHQWPWLSLIIATISQYLSISTANAAYTLSITLNAVIVVSFILIGHCLTRSKRIIYVSAAVILLHPIINDYRSDIIRDHGLWAFTLLSLFFLLKFNQSKLFRYAILWSLFITMAFAFRLEALIFSFAAPLAILATRHNNRFNYATAFKGLLAVILVYALLIGILVASDLNIGRTQVNKFVEFWPNLLSKSYDNIQAFSEIISRDILSVFSSDFGRVVLIGGLICMLAWQVADVITPLFAVTLILLKGNHDRQLVTHQWHVIKYLAILAVPYLLVYTLNIRFVSERYLVMSSLLVLLGACLLINSFLNAPASQHSRKRRFIVFLLLAITALDGLSYSTEKSTLTDKTANWISENTPQDYKILTNSEHIAYFSRRSSSHFSVDQLLEISRSGASNPGLASFDAVVLITRKSDRRFEEAAQTINYGCHYFRPGKKYVAVILTKREPAHLITKAEDCKTKQDGLI